MTKPVVALTLGDPAGIGPEIALKALRKRNLCKHVNLVLIGDPFVLESIAPCFSHVPNLPHFSSIEQVADAGTYPCLLNLNHRRFNISPGRLDARCGRISIDYVKEAVRLATTGKIDGIVTGPIHKQAWAAAGSRFSGHTEMLASASGSRDFAMAFFAKDFLTVLLSTHLALKDALALLSVPLLERKVDLTVRALKEMGIRRPRLAVAGVNPHAGEGGLLGDEEIKFFSPAIKKCQEKGLNVSGPYSADTVYLRAARGEFDAVLAPYHDQAMLAVKTLSFGHATNITLGLPFVRTSVDHGTAFDIAGKGVANESALVDAIEKCRDLIRGRQGHGSKHPQ
ncbi:MAG: 4-hydroxythreonine-4-phosphate dehydrogenase PdxA [Acidobacteriia bacterium]|nr:4-hydroxythreonine-4-phosphate dehydrogenase PdxA [Terriglobia bacterium]